MGKFILRICNLAFDYYKRNRFSRGWIFAYDVFMTVLSYFIVQFAVTYPGSFDSEIVCKVFPIVVVYSLSFILFKSYTGMMRFSEFADIKRISMALCTSFVVLFLLKFGLYNISGSTIEFANRFFPHYSIMVYHTALSFAFLVSSRLLIRGLYLDFYRKTQYSRDNNVLIFGAGRGGTIAYRLISHENCDYNIVAFVDDDRKLDGQNVGGIRIYHSQFALTQNFVERKNIKTLVLAVKVISNERKKAIIETALKLKLDVKVLGGLNDFVSDLSVNKIKDVQIEDLLGRPPIQLDHSNIKDTISGKSVLVTGAAGSIGSEICRQVMMYNPRCLIMVDHAESALYDFQFEMKNAERNKGSVDKMFFYVANVRDANRMEGIYKRYHPEIVFHAAAYKHVPFMEEFPYEAVRTNVFGTKVMADLAIKYKVGLFVMISTDKAVRPTNVMGATKRTAEIYIQSRKSDTVFVTTRFGNVLGSNGSVVPLFKKQIEKGGPITVTDFRITRFFMTIPEACSLVLEASAIGKKDELFIFDMGNPVKIYDLAKKMIELSHVDNIDIVEIGLRPGEKITEELLLDSENLKPTSNKKIMIAAVDIYDKEVVDNLINNLSDAVENGDCMTIVARMKDIVKEYVSNNSIYCDLDKDKRKP